MRGAWFEVSHTCRSVGVQTRQLCLAQSLIQCVLLLPWRDAMFRVSIWPVVVAVACVHVLLRCNVRFSTMPHAIYTSVSKLAAAPANSRRQGIQYACDLALIGLAVATRRRRRVGGSDAPAHANACYLETAARVTCVTDLRSLAHRTQHGNRYEFG